eukprot:jgi/Botrbrau1/8798/Bobra.0330s0029.1
MNAFTIRLPLAFHSKDAEEQYQAQHGMPAVPFYITLLLGIFVKIFVIINTARRPASPERRSCQILGIAALGVAVLEIVLALAGKNLFKKTWRALSAVHFVLSAAHAMISHAFLTNTETLEIPNPSVLAYINLYLVSSCAIPFFTISVGSGLPIWLQTAAHVVIAATSLAVNPAFCSKLARHGDTWIHRAAAQILEIISGVGNVFFCRWQSPCGSAHRPHLRAGPVWNAGPGSLCSHLRERRRRDAVPSELRSEVHGT